MARATHPFQFMSRLSVPVLTGVSASNAQELLWGVQAVHPSSIFLHTHNFLMLDQYMALELASDFAFWVREALHEERLAERLAFVNPGDYSHVEQVRKALVEVLQGWLDANRELPLRAALAERRFHFVRSNTFVFPLPLQAWDLESFVDMLHQAGLNSVFYHAFESKLIHEQTEDDFVLWVRHSVGDDELADALQRMDLYAISLPSLPHALARTICEKRSARGF